MRRHLLRVLPIAVMPAALAAVAVAPSRADAPLALPMGTSPRSLYMRGAAWRVAATENPAADPEPGSESIFSLPSGGSLTLDGGDLDRITRHGMEQDVVAPPKPLSDRLVLRFNLGMGLDGGEPADGGTRLSGEALNETTDYEKLRIYSFGDAVLGSRGLGATGLNGYIATHFRNNQPYTQNSTALPSNYDRRLRGEPIIRSAYVEVDEVFQHRLLRPVHIRGGRSFQYGVAPMHFDGVTVGYHTPMLRLSVYAGQRASMVRYSRRNFENDGALGGYTLRADLFEWKRWPLVINASGLVFDGHQHFRTGLALRWNRDVLVGASLRSRDGNTARSSLSVDARLSEVTTINVQVHRRGRADWSYGLSQVAPGPNFTAEDEERSASDPRRYLDLGPVLPRTLFSLRYGTVLLRNIDLLVRGGAALDGRDEDSEEASSFSASYAEGGAALELQMRRAIRIGAAVTARRYFLDDVDPDPGTPGFADPLPLTTAATGVTSFWEGGLSLIYSPGARLFRGSAEFFGRRYGFLSEYLPDTITAVRTGGRFGFEGWVAKRLRLRGEYDVTIGPLLMAPELTGLKTLRLLLEGTF